MFRKWLSSEMVTVRVREKEKKSEVCSIVTASLKKRVTVSCTSSTQANGLQNPFGLCNGQHH